MARIRSTHPGQWTAGDFLECSPLARLLALALRNVADDNGAFRWKPTTLKAECLPADNCEIGALLEELVRNNQIIKYAVDGKEYGLIKDFTQWQRPKKPKYIHPVPPEFVTSTEPIPNQLPTEPEIPPQRKEEGGRREEVEESIQPVARATAASSRFDEFWKEYPKRDGDNPRKPAEKKFNALVKTGVDPEAIIVGARYASAAARARGDYGTKFVPQAIKWLNDQRFQDYAVSAFDVDAPIDWDAICISYKKYGIWSKHAPGNGPDSSSCLCPEEILVRHGIWLARAESEPVPVPVLQRMQ